MCWRKEAGPRLTRACTRTCWPAAPPPDDDEATEQDVDAALQMLGRRHSFFPIRDSNSPSTSGSMRGLRNSMRVTEDEDFMHR